MSGFDAILRSLTCPALLHALALLLLLSDRAACQPAAAGRTDSLECTEIDRALEDGPVRREISGGCVHRYSVALTPGSYLYLLANQEGADVSLTLLDSAGKQLVSIDSPTGNQGPEQLAWVAKDGGEYRAEVRSLEKAGIRGAYELTSEKRSRPSPADRVRVLAQTAQLEGDRLASEPSADSLRKAAELHERSLLLWREVGDRRGEALIEQSLGQTYHALNDLPNALRHYAAAVELWRNLKDRPQESAALGGLATIEYRMSHSERALTLYLDALSIERSIGDQWKEGELLSNIGMVHDSVGEKEKALTHYLQALPLMRATKNKSGETRTLGNIAALYDSEGQKQKALDAYRQALFLSRELKSRKGEAVYLSSTGRVYADLGEPERALEYMGQSLTLIRALGDKRFEATTLQGMAQVSADQKDWPRAIQLYEESLALFREVGDRRREASCLESIGEAYSQLQEGRTSLEFLGQALSLARETSDRYLEGVVSTSLGRQYAVSGDSRRARELLGQALPIRREVLDRFGEITTLFELARLERAEGGLSAARGLAETALDRLEDSRAEVATPDLRASYFSRFQTFYEFYIDLLMEIHRGEPTAGFDQMAVLATERARARSLLDLLVEARADIRQGIDPTLLEREKSLQRLIAGKLDRYVRLVRERSAADILSPASVEIESLRAAYQDVQAAIRSSSPGYAALTRPQSLRFSEIQEFIDGETVLLDYWLGEERGFLWVITSSSLTSYELPGRFRIQEAARKFYAYLTAPAEPARVPGPRPKEARVPGATTGSPGFAGDLAEALLRFNASGGKRLAIVADGMLQYIPFAALPAPFPGADRAAHRILLDHETIYLPSLSAFALQRGQLSKRNRPPKTLAIFADPVFTSDDVRVARRTSLLHPAAYSRGPGEPVTRSLDRSASDLGIADKGLRLPRLPFTRREAYAISKLVEGSERKVALDFDASLEAARSEGLTSYRFVHFATHGLINSTHPELSGVILSLVDHEGRAQEGFLAVPEIFNLRLTADLVVLSACQTALGKEIRGEGLVGLTRAFMYAGAPRVVASLWRVDDAATAELMKRFYEGMLGPKKLRPGAALREAQLAISRQKRWEHPYYWAGFVLQGEWR